TLAQDRCFQVIRGGVFSYINASRFKSPLASFVRCGDNCSSSKLDRSCHLARWLNAHFAGGTSTVFLVKIA
ncbi:hypothetical protein ACFL6U_31395, partial [Planctomycetota bacterium]